jgi:hypothetical protein
MKSNEGQKGQDPQQAKQQGKQGNQQQQEAASGAGQQYGEGSYSGTKQYNEGLKEHVQNHDIEREARDAAPKNDDEAREMEDAERVAKSRARGAGADSGPDSGKTGTGN